MKIPKRIAQALLNSLKGGVVPRVGAPLIAVGRKEEIDALLPRWDIIAEGGAFLPLSGWKIRQRQKASCCKPFATM